MMSTIALLYMQYIVWTLNHHNAVHCYPALHAIHSVDIESSQWCPLLPCSTCKTKCGHWIITMMSIITLLYMQYIVWTLNHHNDVHCYPGLHVIQCVDIESSQWYQLLPCSICNTKCGHWIITMISTIIMLYIQYIVWTLTHHNDVHYYPALQAIYSVDIESPQWYQPLPCSMGNTSCGHWIITITGVLWTRNRFNNII